MLSSIKRKIDSVQEIIQKTYIVQVKLHIRKIPAFIDKWPLTSLGIILGALFTTIIIGSLFRKPPTTVGNTIQAPKKVEVFYIGKAPLISVDGQVEKSGVVTIVAQTSGVVQSINVVNGQDVWRGTVLVGLSSNYQGGSVFSLQRQLAQTQFDNVEDTYKLQKDTIARQRELANDININDANLRDISQKTNEQTEQAIHLNDEILSTLNSQLATLISTGASENDILAKKQIISQYKSANLQLSTSLRNGQYTASDDGIVADISVINRDVLLSQLKLQEKALDLSRETAEISLQIAKVSESLMYPTVPFAGRIEKIHVRVGQSVSPGMPIATISGLKSATTVTAYVPKSIINKISPFENSIITIGDVSITLRPIYISREAVRGRLYAVMFAIPEQYTAEMTDMELVRIDLPIGSADTGAVIPFIPIDSVYQSDASSTVFVVEENTAVSRDVILGGVQGSFVEVVSGIKANDAVIVDRNVINGDAVEIID